MPPVALVCSAVSFLPVCNSHMQMAFSSPSRPLPSLQTSAKLFPEEDCQAFTTCLPHGVSWPALAPSCLGGQLAHSAGSLTPPQHLCSGGPALMLTGLLGATCLCWLQGVLQWVWGRALCETLCSKLCLISRATRSKGSGIFWSLGT